MINPNKIQDLSEEQLRKEKKKNQDWINSDVNDGRLTTGSSAQLDYAWDMIEDIDKELKHRGLAL